MWNFDDIEIENFRSHEHTKYKFQNGKSVLVYGVNEDDKYGADSNGSGKSSIMLAITVALVGIPNRNLAKSDYVLDGKKQAKIVLRMHNSLLNKHVTIIRKLHVSASNKAEIWIDDEIDNQVISDDSATKKVLELLDISKEDLLNYFIINQENSHSFFRATDQQKKQVIARFSNSYKLDYVLESIKSQKSLIERQIEKLRTEMASNEARVEAYEEMLEDAISNNDNSELIEKKKQSIKKLEQRLYDTHESLDEVKKAEKLAKKQCNTDISKIKSNLEMIEVVQKDSLRKKRRLQRKVAGLEKIMLGKIDCPKCSHEFLATDEEVDINACREDLDENQKELEHVEKILIELERESTEYAETIEKYNRNQSKLKRIKMQIEDLTEDAGDLIERIDVKTKELSEINESDDKAEEIAGLKQKIEKYNNLVEDLIDKINENTEELNIVKFWEVNFGKGGFRAYLIREVLQTLEGYVNMHLQSFKVDMVVKIDGFTETSSGKINEKISVKINMNGKGWQNYARFSGGQRERINICGILTLQTLINMSSSTGGLNFLGLDETFEGLDMKGQKMVLPLLEKCGVTNMVITHQNYDIGAKNVLCVTYFNGKSKIIANG